jgi:hypothetical protein
MTFHRPILCLACLASAPVCSTAAPSFRHEIMPLFSRMGCNAGACHGSANGKGNLKLSLRGENPAADFAELTGSRKSKRLNVDDPGASFLLKKPAKLVEHEGGQRFGQDSEEFRLLQSWIAAGAADDAAAPALTRLTVSPAEAVLEERTVSLQGTSRDVTRWAVMEPSNLLVEVSRDGVVTAQRSGETTVIVRFEQLQTPVSLAFLPRQQGIPRDAPVPANFIDEHIWAKLQKVRVSPSAVCDDVTFLRRVSFDLAGRLPSRAEAEAFLSDTGPDKRARLVDTLLASGDFAEWWALKWADLLRLEERVLDETGTVEMHRWIRDSLARDRPMDEFCRDILTALGSTYQNPPANYYRALREPTLRAETTAQIFLGTRLACAKCHNHPFERWTQDDYYRFSAVFDGMDYLVLQNRRRDENDKLEFVGEQVVHLDGKRQLKDPRTKQEPAPGLIGDGVPVLSPGPERLAQMAAWMTSAEHPLFAKVQVNRAWAHLMGRGLVDPVDDFRLTNPASIPTLLDALAAQFIKDGMKLKPLLRLICNSRTYQLSSEPNATNADDEINFARAYIRRLPAEPLLDALHAALDVELEMTNFPDATRAVAVSGARFITKARKASPAELFLREFGKPPRATACDCERSNASSLSQVFTLTSGPGLDKLLRKKENRLGELVHSGKSAVEILTDLYWHTLSRPPSEMERARLVPELEKAADARAMLEDIAWSLVNSKEFLLRR